MSVDCPLVLGTGGKEGEPVDGPSLGVDPPVFEKAPGVWGSSAGCIGDKNGEGSSDGVVDFAEEEGKVGLGTVWSEEDFLEVLARRRRSAFLAPIKASGSLTGGVRFPEDVLPCSEGIRIQIIQTG